MRIQRFATGLLAEDVAYELSVVAMDHESVPPGFQRPTSGLLGFIV